MRAAGLARVLLNAQVLIAVVGCGGDTTEEQSGSSGGDVATGGAHAGSGSGGTVSTGGQTRGGSSGRTSGGAGAEPTTGGQGGSASSGGSAGEGGTGGAERPADLLDGLRLERSPADGYCVQQGQVLYAEVIYGETGDYWMSGTMFEDWDQTAPDRCAGMETPDCVVSRFVRLMLTEAQRAELEALLDALPEDRCELDEMMECDPCVITTVAIGGTDHSDYCCGAQLSSDYDDAFQGVVDYLDWLTSHLPCSVNDDACSCLAGAFSMVGDTDSCHSEWPCCIHVPMVTDMMDWSCDCVNASEAECEQLLADSPDVASRVPTCPPP